MLLVQVLVVSPLGYISCVLRCGSLCSGILGYWDTGILGYWDTGILRYWDTGILGYWDTGTRRKIELTYSTIDREPVYCTCMHTV